MKQIRITDYSTILSMSVRIHYPQMTLKVTISTRPIELLSCCVCTYAFTVTHSHTHTHLTAVWYWNVSEWIYCSHQSSSMRYTCTAPNRTDGPQLRLLMGQRALLVMVPALLMTWCWSSEDTREAEESNYFATVIFMSRK